MDRNARRLSHQKGSKIVTQTNVPISSDGDDGDQVMVGSTLYIKTQGRWMPFKPGGNVNDGWHGSQKYVRILPHQFMLEDNTATAAKYIVFDDDSNQGLRVIGTGGYGTPVFAVAIIPLGYKAVAAKIYADATVGSGTPIAQFFHIYRATLDGSAAYEALDGTPAGVASNTEHVFAANKMYIADELHYYAIKCKIGADAEIIYGGYIRIDRVSSAQALGEEASSEGGSEGGGLPRSSGG